MRSYWLYVPQEWSSIIGKLHQATQNKVEHDAGNFSYVKVLYKRGWTAQVLFDTEIDIEDRFAKFTIELISPDGDTKWSLVFVNNREDYYFNIRFGDALSALWGKAYWGEDDECEFDIFETSEGGN